MNALLKKVVAQFLPEWPHIDKQTALLWEPCSKSHGEVVPGYAKILLDLGYRVVVLMTPDRISEGLFSRFEHPNLVLTTLTQRRIRKLVKTPVARQAGVLFISTAGKLPHRPDATLDLTTVFGTEFPAPLLVVEHDAKTKIDKGVWTENTITLRRLDYADQSSTIVNPHFFGEIDTTPKSDGRCVFLMIGAARAKRRNQDLIYDAAEQLVEHGVSNFEIRLIGKKGGDAIPDKLQPHVKTLGRLDFREMYHQIEQSDFIVTAFQADNPEHEPYRTVKTTGSFQLCYGFAKPCILQKDFATGTALNSDNSLFYASDEDVAHALRRAIDMSATDYYNMQQAMQAAATKLYQQSVTNVELLING